MVLLLLSKYFASTNDVLFFRHTKGARSQHKVGAYYKSKKESCASVTGGSVLKEYFAIQLSIDKYSDKFPSQTMCEGVVVEICRDHRMCLFLNELFRGLNERNESFFLLGNKIILVRSRSEN